MMLVFEYACAGGVLSYLVYLTIRNGILVWQKHYEEDNHDTK
jgi:hypothetical protein